MKKILRWIVIILIIAIIALVVKYFSDQNGITDKNFDGLIDNIYVFCEGNGRTLIEHEQKSDPNKTDGIKPLTMNVKYTVESYSEDVTLKSLFQELLDGYANNDEKINGSIKKIISDGIGRMVRYTDHLVIDAQDLTKEVFTDSWNLPELPNYETVFLPPELLDKNANKTLSFMADDYYINMPSAFFGENGAQSNEIVNLNYVENTSFTITFTKSDYTTKWNHPMLLRLNHISKSDDVVVLRDDEKVPRSYKKGDELYLYVYAEGTYKIQECDYCDENKFISFAKNRGILDEETLNKPTINRGEFIGALIRSGYTENSSKGIKNLFGDINSDDTYFDEIVKGCGLDVVQGTGNGQVDSEAPLTLEQAYALVERFITASQKDDNQVAKIDIMGVYPHTKKIANIDQLEFAKKEIENLQSKGFILPQHVDSNNGYFDYKGYVTMGDAMEIIYQLITNGGGGLEYAE